MNKVGTAYVLWLGGLFGLAGLHRLYNGQIRTGLLWLFTGGLFGFGQLLDLLFIPKMVEAHNARLAGGSTITSTITIAAQVAEPIAPLSQIARSQAIVALLKAAEARGGKLSVTQGVMATGLGFTEVETLLTEMLKTGYVDICNDPESGIVLYEFKEFI